MDSNLAAVAGEFTGTAVLILLGEGVVAAAVLAKTKAANAGWIAITTGWGLAVALGIIVASALGDKDGHLNPAFTIASVLMSGHAGRLWLYIPAQLAGAFTGAILNWLFYFPHWSATSNADDKLAVFCTAPAIRHTWSNFLGEVIGSFVLVLVATAFASKRISPAGTPPAVGPVLVGALVWSIGLSLGATTGYAINPARDLAPRLAHALLPVPGKRDSDWGYAWIPVLGPICGAVLAALFVNWTGMV